MTLRFRDPGHLTARQLDSILKSRMSPFVLQSAWFYNGNDFAIESLLTSLTILRIAIGGKSNHSCQDGNRLSGYKTLNQCFGYRLPKVDVCRSQDFGC